MGDHSENAFNVNKLAVRNCGNVLLLLSAGVVCFYMRTCLYVLGVQNIESSLFVRVFVVCMCLSVLFLDVDNLQAAEYIHAYMSICV